MSTKISIDVIKKAFKKLKSHIYYDKTALILRDEIVKYEVDGDGIENKLNKIIQYFDNDENQENNFQECVKKDILNKIDVIVLPKRIPVDDVQNKIVLNYDVASLKYYNIEDIQFFINMPVEGHILGMLWIMLVGDEIDKTFNWCYGNRIKENLYDAKGEFNFSPYVFQPYYVNYESWRDEALNITQNIINDKNNFSNAIVLTMDFKRYYYSVDITKKFMEDIFKDCQFDEDENPIEYLLNNFVYSICEKYSKEYRTLIKPENDKINSYERNVLPIGFLPSGILANRYLQEFDKAIIDGINPTYYGRYVDDIIFVDKVEEGSHLSNNENLEMKTGSNIFEYFFTDKIKLQSRMLDKLSSIFEPPTSNREDGVWYLNNEYMCDKDSKAELCVESNDKMKVFYFKHGASDDLIQCFRNHILRNKSEFNFMPEEETIFTEDDVVDIYHISDIETNKLREINGLKLDKYKLSKFIGKFYRINYITSDSSGELIKCIDKIFTNSILVENYVLWERLIGIYCKSNDPDLCKKIVQKIKSAIKSISGKYSVSIKRYLNLVLLSAIYRQLVFKDSKMIEVASKMWVDHSFDAGMLSRYLLSRMYDKNNYLLSPAYVGCKTFYQNSRFNILSEKEFSLFSSTFEESYDFYPYYVNEFDICLANVLKRIIEGNDVYSHVSRWGIMKKSNAINFKNDNPEIGECDTKAPCKKCDECKEVKSFLDGKSIKYDVFMHKAEKFFEPRIAVANIKLSNTDATENLLGNPNRTYKRYQSLSHIINIAIKEKANMIVIPENAMPIEWLPLAVRVCKNKGIALITGIEHIVIDKKVYNLTAIVLPYEDKKSGRKDAYVSFHIKNHLAPGEIDLITRLGLIPVESGDQSKYELYMWNDIWFSVYCCFELTSIFDRSLFQSYVDMIVAVEWNHDVNYFSNIVESLSRDLHCYCIQANTSDYGDSRITQPTKTEKKDIVRIKGGENSTVVIGTVNIEKLRQFQVTADKKISDKYGFKPTPPNFNKEIVLKKIKGDYLF